MLPLALTAVPIPHAVLPHSEQDCFSSFLSMGFSIDQEFQGKRSTRIFFLNQIDAYLYGPYGPEYGPHNAMILFALSTTISLGPGGP